MIIKNKILQNTLSLYLLTFAKMIVPLLTLPYFTRVLSVDGYAVVSYVKSVMTYVQVFLDFGFALSATKEIVEANNDKEKISKILGESMIAKGLLAILSLAFCFVLSTLIPLLRDNLTYVFLSYFAIALTIFLPDYVFRGLEKMHILTIRFVIMKGISTVLSFVFIRGDHQLLLIPLLDILGTLVAIVWTWAEIKKMGIWPIFTAITDAFHSLKTSFVYFMSDAATTIFGAFNTMLIGIMLSKQDIAFWSVASQLIAAVQALYSPITSGVYPHMVRKKDMRLILRMCAIFMPIVFAGVGLAYHISDWVIVLVSGEKYIGAAAVLRSLLPLLVISFLSMLFGWPCLGAINKQKQVTLSTVLAAVVQILVLVLLIIAGKLTLFTIAFARIISEVVLLLVRSSYCVRYRMEFKGLNAT